MGRNNRRRRAEKAARKRRRQATNGTTTHGHTRTGRPLGETELVDLAAAAYRGDRDDLLVAAARRLADRPRDLVVSVMAESLEFEVAAAWERGWQPAELVGLVGRDLNHDEVALARGVLGAQAVSYQQWGAAVAPRWMAQLGSLDVVPGARSTADLLLGGAGAWREIIVVALRLLGLLRTAPRIPTLTPPPSQWSSPGPRGEQAERLPPEVLSRIRALLAKAESTDFDAEAESFTAKAQELMTRHRIDRATVSSHAPDTVIGVRLVIEPPYANAKAVLLSGIAGANGCRAVWTRDLGFATLFGHPDDLEGVEELFTSLLVQATAALRREGPRRDRSGRSRTRRFRQSFLAGFAQRVSERLTETATETVHRAEAETGRAVLAVLGHREAAAEQAMRETYDDLGSFGLSVSDLEGRLRGSRMGDEVDLALGPDETRLPAGREQLTGNSQSRPGTRVSGTAE